jgi:hypothetical protein
MKDGGQKRDEEIHQIGKAKTLSQLSEELRANKKKILSKPSDDSKTVKKYTNKLSEDLKTNKKRTLSKSSTLLLLLNDLLTVCFLDSVFNVLFCFAGCDFSSELNKKKKVETKKPKKRNHNWEFQSVAEKKKITVIFLG